MDSIHKERAIIKILCQHLLIHLEKLKAGNIIILIESQVHIQPANNVGANRIL